MKFYSSEKKQRLTLSQAMVKFLQAQYSEYDGVEHRFFQGIWGIFGHGNVSGLSQALVEYGDDLPYHQPTNEQSMVHAVTGFARTMRRKATMACTTSIGPGGHQYDYRGGHGNHLPSPSAVAALRLLCHAVSRQSFAGY